MTGFSNEIFIEIPSEVMDGISLKKLSNYFVLPKLEKGEKGTCPMCRRAKTKRGTLIKGFSMGVCNNCYMSCQHKGGIELYRMINRVFIDGEGVPIEEDLSTPKVSEEAQGSPVEDLDSSEDDTYT